MAFEKVIFLGLIACCVGTSARVARAQVPAPPIVDTAAGQPESAQPEDTVTLTPLSQFYNGYEQQTTAATGANFSDAYTRIYIQTSGTLSGKNKLEYKPRGPIQEYLFGKEASINLTVSIDAGSFTAVVPLMTIDHKSNITGEQWSRTLYQTAENYPLFLIGRDGKSGTPAIKASLKGNLTGSSQVAGSTIDVVLGVARAVQPEAQVVTELSKPAIKAEASAIDGAVSKLFDRAIVETNEVDQDLRYWSPGAGIRLQISIPKGDFNIGQAGHLQVVGAWFIKFESPRPSIFVDWRICSGRESDDKDGPKVGITKGEAKSDVQQHYLPVQLASSGAPIRCAGSRNKAVMQDMAEANSAAIMRTSLAGFSNGLGQVGSYLSQQDWYKAAVPKLSTPSSAQSTIKCATAKKGGVSCAAEKPKADFGGVGDICKQINSSMIGLGLSTFDAGLVTWAWSKEATDVPAEARAAMLKNDDCKKFITPVEAAKAKHEWPDDQVS